MKKQEKNTFWISISRRCRFYVLISGADEGNFSSASQPTACGSSFSRLAPLLTRQSSGLSPFTVAPFRLRFPPHIKKTPIGVFSGADEGNRTPVASLGSWSSAIEPHPQGISPFCRTYILYLIFQFSSNRTYSMAALIIAGIFLQAVSEMEATDTLRPFASGTMKSP